MATIAEPEKLPLGSSLPPGNPHGVSVHLPTWADTVGWASREPRVLNAMKTGYPRFFISRLADRLAMQLLEMQQAQTRETSAKDRLGEEGKPQRLAILLDSVAHAQACRRALPKWNDPRSERFSAADIGVHVVSWKGAVTPVEDDETLEVVEKSHRGNGIELAQVVGNEDIVLVSYPAELAAEAKAFWQHTGFGISSRRATHWLEHAPFLSKTAAATPMPSPTEISIQLEQARDTLRSRIAAGQSSTEDDLTVPPSDVFLFPTGMTAIAETADAIKSLRRATPDQPYRVAVFGFLYVDTYKVLSRVLGFVPTLFHADPSSITAFEALLTPTPTPTTPTPPPKFDAIFTEFPGNPLLQSPSLTHLHHLSQTHHIPLVVDDTIGTHASLRLLASCDVVCTSLTKMFSGACDVMGGAVTLNPRSPYYRDMRGVLEGRRVEGEGGGAWFWRDVVKMEYNSRDFGGRVERASGNAERVVAMLRGSGSVREVFYPLGSASQGVYDSFRREGAGYGFLLSIRFTEPKRAVAFYDALDVAKGPSLGTNFTLCCAYTLLAHYKELEWAAEYGVVEDLVRISVGLEEWAWLEERVGRALQAAERMEAAGQTCP